MRMLLVVVCFHVIMCRSLNVCAICVPAGVTHSMKSTQPRCAVPYALASYPGACQHCEHGQPKSLKPLVQYCFLNERSSVCKIDYFSHPVYKGVHMVCVQWAGLSCQWSCHVSCQSCQSDHSQATEDENKILWATLAKTSESTKQKWTPLLMTCFTIEIGVTL